jgi:hypothetical protein
VPRAYVRNAAQATIELTMGVLATCPVVLVVAALFQPEVLHTPAAFWFGVLPLIGLGILAVARTKLARRPN